jgi:hypothetical protein
VSSILEIGFLFLSGWKLMSCCIETTEIKKDGYREAQMVTESGNRRIC